MKGEDCVSENECGCFIDEVGVIEVCFYFIDMTKVRFHGSKTW